jgi:hypothetical protein
MPNEPFAKGHCLCGAVSYTVNAKPIRMTMSLQGLPASIRNGSYVAGFL